MPISQTQHAIHSRSTWRSLFERDVDLIILNLLHSSEVFRGWLLERVVPDLVDGLQITNFAGAWHSVIDPLGHETDLEAEWILRSGGRFTLLIEDKIDARCQPDQAARYGARAERYVADGRSEQAVTLLIAPADYPSKYREDTAPFESSLALEDIAEWCETADIGPRGDYVARMLRHALTRWKSNGPDGNVKGKPTYPRIYEVVREELASGSFRLSISNSTPSAWVYFGFEGKRPGSLLRYRLTDHWVELVLGRKQVAAEALSAVLTSHPLISAAVTSRGATELALWIPTPELDLTASATSQRDQIRGALAIADTLRKWYVRHATVLQPSG
jgi:hypothetical protein